MALQKTELAVLRAVNLAKGKMKFDQIESVVKKNFPEIKSVRHALDRLVDQGWIVADTERVPFLFSIHPKFKNVRFDFLVAE